MIVPTSSPLRLLQAIAAGLVCLGLAACGGPQACDGATPGVLLSFDDFDPSWEASLPLFARHNARATFYARGAWLRDLDEIKTRLLPLQEAGHEIGVHTVRHRRASYELMLHRERWLQDDVLLAKKNLEAALGEPMRAFAYPYGENTGMTQRALAPYFAWQRGFREGVRFYPAAALRQTPRFLLSTSIDNRWRRDDAFFEKHLDALVASECEIWPITAHGVDWRRWGITPERLSWLLEAITARGLVFYLPADLIE